MSNHYHLRNWSHYNKSLGQRGSISLWFDEKSIRNWHNSLSEKKVGHPKLYSDMAIICALTLKAVFRLTLRSTEGFLSNLITLLKLPLQTPDYTTLCKRQKTLEITLKVNSSGPITDRVIDSSGFKVYGEGEWKVRQHGYSKRRTWRKLQLAVDAQNHCIVSAMLTTADVNDKEVMPELLAPISQKITRVITDKGYDSFATFEQINSRGSTPVIPLRQDARIRQHGNSKAAPLARDEVLREIRRLGKRLAGEESLFSSEFS